MTKLQGHFYPIERIFFGTLGFCLSYLLKIYFKLRLKKVFSNNWDKSTINLWNKEKNSYTCHFCNNGQNEVFKSLYIKSCFSLYEKNIKSLYLYYGLNIPRFIWNKCGRLRSTYTMLASEAISNKSKIDFLECKNCGLVYQNYPHEQTFLDLHYTKFYRVEFGNKYERYNHKSNNEVKNYQAKTLINKLKLGKNSKILDLGAGEGTFCNSLSNMGMKSYGIEPSRLMTEAAKKYYNLDIKCATYNTASYPPNSFDVIYSYHVLEHILDLDKVFKAINFHLKKGGILSVSVPSFEKIRNNNDCQKVLLHDHIFCFSEKWFKLNLPKYGLKLIETQNNSFDESKVANINICKNGDHPGAISIIAKKVS